MDERFKSPDYTESGYSLNPPSDGGLREVIQGLKEDICPPPVIINFVLFEPVALGELGPKLTRRFNEHLQECGNCEQVVQEMKNLFRREK